MRAGGDPGATLRAERSGVRAREPRTLLREALVAFVCDDTADDVLYEALSRSKQRGFPSHAAEMIELIVEHVTPSLARRIGAARAADVEEQICTLVSAHVPRGEGRTTTPPARIEACWVVAVSVDPLLDVVLGMFFEEAVVSRVASVERLAGLDARPDVVVVDARRCGRAARLPAWLRTTVVVWGDDVPPGQRALRVVPASASLDEVALVVRSLVGADARPRVSD